MTLPMLWNWSRNWFFFISVVGFYRRKVRFANTPSISEFLLLCQKLLWAQPRLSQAHPYGGCYFSCLCVNLLAHWIANIDAVETVRACRTIWSCLSFIQRQRPKPSFSRWILYSNIDASILSNHVRKMHVVTYNSQCHQSASCSLTTQLRLKSFSWL